MPKNVDFWLLSEREEYMDERMGKYRPLWEYVQSNGGNSLKLTFEEIQSIAGIPIDHSFLKCKRELTVYGLLF